MGLRPRPPSRNRMAPSDAPNLGNIEKRKLFKIEQFCRLAQRYRAFVLRSPPEEGMASAKGVIPFLARVDFEALIFHPIVDSSRH
jgi:hypothetical protein